MFTLQSVVDDELAAEVKRRALLSDRSISREVRHLIRQALRNDEAGVGSAGFVQSDRVGDRYEQS